MPVELRDQGVFDGRFFGKGERLETFLSTADAAYRWLQQGPLRDVADRAVPPSSPRCYADCWLAVVYSLAWEDESPLLLARERSLCESVGPGEASAFYHVRFAFMERDVFTMSEEAVRLLQARAVGATPKGKKPKSVTAADPDGTSGAAPRRGDEEGKPNPERWALGLETGDVWHVFQKVKRASRLQKKLVGPRKGRQAGLLRGFLDGGGFLKKNDALKLERRTYSDGERDKLMHLITPELSKLRSLIREAIGGNGRMDPLPWDDARDGWCAAIHFGFAEKVDGEYLGGESRLRFIPADTASNDERIDRS
jgi:hypothetical protein